MTMVPAPRHGPDRIAVALKAPQAHAGLRIPEADIAGAGKEAPLVGMPEETLDGDAIDHLQAAPRAEVPQSDRPVPSTGEGSALTRIKNRMIDAVRVPLEYLQWLPGWHRPETDHAVSAS